jgi:hypothetical protein
MPGVTYGIKRDDQPESIEDFMDFEVEASADTSRLDKKVKDYVDYKMSTQKGIYQFDYVDFTFFAKSDFDIDQNSSYMKDKITEMAIKHI